MLPLLWLAMAKLRPLDSGCHYVGLRIWRFVRSFSLLSPLFGLFSSVGEPHPTKPTTQLPSHPHGRSIGSSHTSRLIRSGRPPRSWWWFLIFLTVFRPTIIKSLLVVAPDTIVITSQYFSTSDDPWLPVIAFFRQGAWAALSCLFAHVHICFAHAFAYLCPCST